MPPLETFAAQARADADIPPYPNGAMSFALIEKAVADGSRVLVSGLGGDDWLVGVPVYYGEDLAARRFGAVFACLSDDLTELGARATASRFARSAILRVLPGETHDLARVLLHRRRPDELAGVSSWLSPLGRRLLEDRRDARETELRHFPAHHRYKIAKLTSPSFQMALRASERHAAHLGAELRSPMFSRPFIEFTLATPERLRQRGNRTKLLHRRAMQGIMPAKVLNRPDKAAFCLTFRRLFPDLLFLKVAPVPPGLAALLHDRTYLAELASRANALDDAPIYPVWAAYAAFLLSEAAA
jgi:asparagine synthase (glutamine-hydrolysing)